SGPAATETATPEPSPTWQIPTPEPGSGEIVFDYFANEALRDKTELFVVNGDGTGKAQLTFTSDRAEAQPSWSPDYRQVAYTTSRADRSSDPWQIAVLDRDTGQSRIITSGPDEYEPDWSPDGSRIAYTSLSGMGTSVIVSEIRTIAPDGIIARILIRMLSPSYTLMNPTYSPGGAQIAFTVGSDYSGGELYVMDSNGQNVRKIFSHDYYNDIDPAWSPDGRYIAFASGPVWGSVNNTIHSIWLVDLQSGAAGAIASVPTWDLRRPAWSPDGTEIVFNARFETDPSRYALYVVPIVGGSVRGPLSVGVEPDWGAKSLILPTPGPLPTQTPTEVTPPTPPVFPTLPTPLPTVVGPTPTNVPPPTFPPPTDEPTSTPPPTSTEPPTVELPTETATATATPEATSGIYMPVAHNGSEPTD
ncbi:MAG: hypothetical protein ACK2UL_03530, partial [Anaerolineae bacterium]